MSGWTREDYKQECYRLRERVAELEKANQILRIGQDNMGQVIAGHIADKLSLAAENKRLRADNEALRARLDWAANELLACDYGDNDSGGARIGWIVYGWRNRHQTHPKTRIYGPTIDAAIDAARGATVEGK